MRRAHRSFPALSAAVLLAGLFSSCAVFDRSGRAVTPQRPTFSTDTSTTAAGTREVEAGLTTTDGGSYDTPIVFKYGTDDQTEIFAGISPYVRATGQLVDDEGVGDLVLGWRHRLQSRRSARSATALLFAVKLPADDEPDGVTSGAVDAFASGIWSETRGSTSMTAQYQFGAVGEPGGGGADIEHGLALAFGHPVEGPLPNLSGFVELAGTFTPERDDEQVFTTFGFAHSPEPWIVLDLFAAVGLTSDAPDFQLGIGITQIFGRP